MTDVANTADRDKINVAVHESIRTYIQERRDRVEPFTERHFSWKGARQLHKKAVGWDMVRTPANVLLAVPHLIVIRGSGYVASKIGANSTAAYLARIPAGVRTDVEREIEWLIYSELLELPCDQGKRKYLRDALFETILQHPYASNLIVAELLRIDDQAKHRDFRERLELYLFEYTNSRTAAADLCNSLLSIAAGVATFKQFTPGALAIGGSTATLIANQLAIANFVLGPALGSFYYGLFPATASMGLLAVTTGGIMVLLGLLSTFAGVVFDPLQQSIGLHDKRLFSLLDALEARLDGQDDNYTLHDAYVARVFDVLDLLKAASRIAL